MKAHSSVDEVHLHVRAVDLAILRGNLPKIEIARQGTDLPIDVRMYREQGKGFAQSRYRDNSFTTCVVDEKFWQVYTYVYNFDSEMNPTF